jgi:pimeloyl-ACP methyl ester carboxylesterase
MKERDLAFPSIDYKITKRDMLALAGSWQKNAISWGLNGIGELAPKISAEYALKFFLRPRHKLYIPRGVFNQIEPDRVQYHDEEVVTYQFGDSKNPTVLMLHGWEGQASDFYRMIQPLVEAGFHVLTVDAPAHGQSSGKKANVFDFIEVVELLRSKYKIEYAIGHSLGGVALGLAQYYSHRFSLLKIVIMGSPNKLETIINSFLFNMRLKNKVRKSFLELVENNMKLRLEELSLELALNDVQGMLIYDRDDPMVPVERGVEIAEKNPNLRLKLTEGLGHVRILREPEVIDDLIQFLLD